MEMINAIIVAAGRGERFRSNESAATPNEQNLPKQFLPLGDKPVYLHSVERLADMPEINALFIVTSPEYIRHVKQDITRFKIKKVTSVIEGGNERQDSVWNGLQALPPETDIVLVHDGVRPFPPISETREAIRIAQKHGAAILAQPSTDTIKVSPAAHELIEAHPLIEQTIERSRVWRAQTPQVFHFSLLLSAYEQIRKQNLVVTDEAQAVELIKNPVYIIPSSSDNIKITTPTDLALAYTFISKG